MRYVWDRVENGEEVKDVQTVSDYITPDKIEQWTPETFVVVSAPTGAGKSYFIQHPFRDWLTEHKFRCLYLIPRTPLLEHFRGMLPDDDDGTIVFRTYQSVATQKSYAPNGSDYTYDVIVCDESHYFIKDANFNHMTDVAFNWVLSQSHAVRIFMSATNDVLIDCFDRWRFQYIGYILENDCNPISSLTFFWKDEQLDVVAKRVITNGEKAIFFLQSAEKALELFRQYKDKGLFLCSKYNKDFSRYMDSALVKALLKDECFDGNLLVTTLALDCGVTLRDRSLTTIVTDVSDSTDVIQCIGRKRIIGADDTLDVYIKARNNNEVGGMLRKQRELKKEIDKFRKDPVGYVARYERSNDPDHLIYDIEVEDVDGTKRYEKRVNQLKEIKIMSDIRTFEHILTLKGNGFIPYTAKQLGCKRYTVVEEEEKVQSLTEYLESIVGKPMLTKEDKEPLITKMDIKQNGRLCRTIKTLAGWLEDSGLPYRLHAYRKYMMVNGKKKDCRAWELVRLNIS